MEAREAQDETREDDGEPPEDATLGGYLQIHERPPAFEGSDGHPYTVSVEVEQVGALKEPYAAYLVFPRWSPGGMGIVGHVQTPVLCRTRSQGEAASRVGELPLLEVKELLEEAIERRQEEDPEW